MQRISRRLLGKLAVTSVGLSGSLLPALASAATLPSDPAGGAYQIQYIQRLVDDLTLDSIYAHLHPNSSSDVVGSIPYGSPVYVLDQADGEKLWYGGTTWYKVALTYGEGWVYETLLGDSPQGKAAPPLPLPVPPPLSTPDPVGPGRSIVIRLADQFLWAFDGSETTVAVGCSTGGKGLETPQGDFLVKKHIRNYMFNSPWPKGSPDWYESEEASYALLFHGAGYFLHDAPWRRIFGPDSQGGQGPLGKDNTGSHGCVNLPYYTAQFLYSWAPDGMPVRVV